MPPPEFCRVAPDVKLGQNVHIYRSVNLYGCQIGDETQIGTFVEIQKGAKIGDHCKIGIHTFICEGVTIESEVFAGQGMISSTTAIPAPSMRLDSFKRKRIGIARRLW